MFVQILEHASTTDHARFLSSHNPAQVKRNVLASFTDVLLLPVTIVPKTVEMTVGVMGAAAGAAGSAAVQGLQMLNPQRWAGNNTIPEGYSQRFDAGGDTLFEIGGEDDEDDELSHVPTRLPPVDTQGEKRMWSTVSPSCSSLTDIQPYPRVPHHCRFLLRPRLLGKH